MGFEITILCPLFIRLRFEVFDGWNNDNMIFKVIENVHKV